MTSGSPRLAVRAIILHQNRLLLVNAWPKAAQGTRPVLWCAPGGGAERGSALPDNLAREVREECGLDITVGAPCLVNEFHDPRGSFHQVDVYFRATIAGGAIDPAWIDPEGVVTERRFFTRAELMQSRFKPDSLPGVAWGDPGGILYDPLEPIVR